MSNADMSNEARERYNAMLIQGLNNGFIDTDQAKEYMIPYSVGGSVRNTVYDQTGTATATAKVPAVGADTKPGNTAAPQTGMLCRKNWTVRRRRPWEFSGIRASAADNPLATPVRAKKEKR